MLLKILQILGFGLGGMLIAIVCNVVLLRFSKSLGIRNKNDVVIRWSNESKPSLGGVSFFVVFVFAAIGYSVTFGEEEVFKNIQFVGLFTAGSIAFLMGLADDAYNTRPLIKLFVQILCGLLFVWTGSHIDLFHSYYPDALITVIWVIIVMNSLNMLDNMDGITGTTVFFILITCLLSSWVVLGFNTNLWNLLNIAIIGAIIGFLTMNIHPSKLFMGDAGSQFIGLFVAYYGMDNLFNLSTPHALSAIATEIPSWLGACIALVAFTPTAVDTLTVVINRLKKGKSPMVGGKDHTTHYLVYSGLTDIKVWFVFVIIGALSCILAVAMVNLVKLETYLPVAFFTAYFIFVFIILYRNTIKYKAPKE